MNGLKFFRQYSFGTYILDFYCPEISLAVELDGGQHAKEENQEYDSQRNLYLEANGVKTLRFWNNEVLLNLDGVLENIFKASQRPPIPLLILRGGIKGI